MQKIRVDKKTGFSIKSPLKLIEIFDENGKLFFYAEKPETKINLPVGSYQVAKDCFFTFGDCIPYKTYILPERTNKGGKNPPLFFREYLGTNPNKCTVDHLRDKLLWDKDFFESLSLGEIDFIREHERGHYLFSGSESDEIKCDLYAFNKLIEKGYNPRQISAYIKNSLSNNYLSQNRKNQIHDFAKQIDSLHH